MRPVRRQGGVRYCLLSRTLSSFMYLAYLYICRPTRKPAQAMTDELNGANRPRGQEPSEHPRPPCFYFLCRALSATGLAVDSTERGRLRSLCA